jgi:hypothetical protein
MTLLRTITSFLLVSLVAGAAFVPASRPTTSAPSSALAFGFLKELGLEKPSWLPDFGGKKKEDEAVKEPEMEKAEDVEAATPEETPEE